MCKAAAHLHNGERSAAVRCDRSPVQQQTCALSLTHATCALRSVCVGVVCRLALYANWVFGVKKNKDTKK